MTEIVSEKLKQLPDVPGVYIMRNEHGNIIYIGKAVNLKNRVKQYFQKNRGHSPKVKAMVENVADFEFIITATEVEALILECNLIKKHKPKYNICLKDDKTYPYLKVTTNEEYPMLCMTRKVHNDGAKYFGPFTSVGAVYDTLRLLRKLFPLRTCKRMNSKRPCLEYHIKQCKAPCAGLVTHEEYQKMVSDVCCFLNGHIKTVENLLIKRMNDAADELNFELAAEYRNKLQAIRKVTEKQGIVVGEADFDAIGMECSLLGTCVQIFFVREGKMLGRKFFLLDKADNEKNETLLTAFLEQYYNLATFIPDTILLPFELGENGLLEEWLAQKAGHTVRIVVPKQGIRRNIVEMAANNAKKFLADDIERNKETVQWGENALKELAGYLGLSCLPVRMECFDISHMQGQETVASMVVFEGGISKKEDYRRFKINSCEGKPDDYKSMREVTLRRYKEKNNNKMPDLIIIDGGKGQLSAALSVVRKELGMSVAVIALAEKYEYIFTEFSSEPVILPRDSKALYLMQRIRDEAHRFAITYHRSLRRKRNLESALDKIRGIGPKRREAVFAFFGSLEKIKMASVDDLLKVKGMNKSAARAVYNFFQVDI